MDLFHPAPIQNLMPYDGHVCNYGFVFNKDTCREYFDKLVEIIPWKPDELVMFGKRVVTSRKIAWFGDSDYEYSYGNTLKKVLPCSG